MSPRKSIAAQEEKSQKNKRKATDDGTTEEASKRAKDNSGKAIPSTSKTPTATAGPSPRATVMNKEEDIIISSNNESEGESSEAELSEKKY